MLRSILSAVALAALVARPAFADPIATTAFDHAQPAAAAMQLPASPPPASSPLDARAPAGFGWG
jgi:hypothetical protein